MDIDQAITILEPQLKGVKEWQKVAIFTTEAVQALVDMAKREVSKENVPTGNYYDK